MVQLNRNPWLLIILIERNGERETRKGKRKEKKRKKNIKKKRGRKKREEAPPGPIKGTSAGMSTFVAASASNSDLPADSRAGPLRRLSQLRAYTHGHLSPQPPLSSSASQRLTRQNTLSSRVNRLCPAPFLTVIEDDSSDSDDASIVETPSNNPAPCPEPEQSARNNSSTSLSSFRGLQIEWPFESRHSESSSSTPSTDLAQSFSQESMARLRGQPSESRADEGAPTSAPAELQSALFDSPDPVATENFSSPKPRQKATIRFFPHQESQTSARPSLPFIPVSRTLPSESCIIKVGRYSERDGLPQPNPTEPSDAPVGFKSKVVSRRHCEFLYVNGQWHIKDVGSSSGTFLNHMRLSQPNMASRLYTVKDGDIVQLGIDFRGGEEMIFRCVRIRIECNRSWQQQPNEFKYGVPDRGFSTRMVLTGT